MSTAPQGGVVPEFTIGDRLRKARETVGMEQGELADAMGVSRNTISNNESGRVKPRRIVINAYALATGVSVEWLQTGDAPTRPGPDGGIENERACRDSNPKPSDPKVAVITRRARFVRDAA